MASPDDCIEWIDDVRDWCQTDIQTLQWEAKGWSSGSSSCSKLSAPTLNKWSAPTDVMDGLMKIAVVVLQSILT